MYFFCWVLWNLNWSMQRLIPTTVTNKVNYWESELSTSNCYTVEKHATVKAMIFLLFVLSDWFSRWHRVLLQLNQIKQSWADVEGGWGGQCPLFFVFFHRIFVTNHLSSSGIVQSPQGHLCVNFWWVIDVVLSPKIFLSPLSEFSWSTPGNFPQTIY